MSTLSGTLIRPTQAEVNLSTLQENLALVRSRVATAKVLAVVKANAYGHGLVPCARALEEGGVDYFGVATPEEGIELRNAKVASKILVFGGMLPEYLPHVGEYGLEPSISSKAQLDQIEALGTTLNRPIEIQIKIDTGMHRAGVPYPDFAALIERINACAHAKLVGVYSHFCSADSKDLHFTKVQLQRFKDCLASVRLPPNVLRHIANSGGILQCKDSYFDMVRAGTLLYGAYPESHLKDLVTLTQALTLRTKVVHACDIGANEGVGYNHTWKSPEPTRIVTLPIGYGDGYLRSLSNRGNVLIRGERFPVVGRVCMDQIMVSVGKADIQVGEDVVLMGSQGSDTISVNEVADTAQTITHDVLASLGSRIVRSY